MTRWHREQGRSNACVHTLAILDEIEKELPAFNHPRPFVTSIRVGAGIPDLYDFEVELELAPGATLAVRYGFADDEYRDGGPLDDEEGAVASLVLESLKECQAFGAGKLADLLHDLRVRTRRIVAGWSAEGTHVSLLDIRLVRTQYWRSADDLTVEVRLRCLGNRLEPTIEGLEVAHPDLLDAELASWRPHMDVRYAAQAALARQGADGVVDQLVLNALALHGDVAEALRTLGSGRLDWLTRELTVFVNDGHVRCHGRDTSLIDVKWNRNSITIFGKKAPASILDTLVGQPVRKIIEHPVLSDDMIILQATSCLEHGVTSVCAEFEQPLRLFCSASGRVW